jgi:hypothetical protein
VTTRSPIRAIGQSPPPLLANRRALLGNRGLIVDSGSPLANRAPYSPIGKYLGIGVKDILIHFTIYTHHLLLLVPLLNLTLFAALPPTFAYALKASLLSSSPISPLASSLTSIAALFFARSNALLTF